MVDDQILVTRGKEVSIIMQNIINNFLGCNSIRGLTVTTLLQSYLRRHLGALYNVRFLFSTLKTTDNYTDNDLTLFARLNSIKFREFMLLHTEKVSLKCE